MKKMRLKNNNKKSNKLRVIKILFLITIIYISFSYSFYYSLRRNKDINNSNFIKSLVRMGNSNNLYNNKLINVVNSTINFITHVDITKPSSIIASYVSKTNNYNSITLEHNDDYSNLEELKKISSYIEDPYKVDISKPIIYLYNTHQLENYNNKNLSIYNITPNVLMASYILKEKLNKNGISTIVEDTNLSEFLNLNHWNYASSYKATRMLLLEKMNKYDSLKYFIDIHRDSVNRNSTTVTINNKTYAKILFVIGLVLEPLLGIVNIFLGSFIALPVSVFLYNSSVVYGFNSPAIILPRYPILLVASNISFKYNMTMLGPSSSFSISSISSLSKNVFGNLKKYNCDLLYFAISF